MADEPAEKKDQQFSFTVGHANLTITAALATSIIGGFYGGVNWVTHVSDITQRNQRGVTKLDDQFAGMNKVFSAANERENQHYQQLVQQIQALQLQLSQLQDNLNRAYEPNVPLRKTKRY